MRARTLFATVAAACVLVGCRHHVRIDPPRPSITPEERVALFWRMRPTQEGLVKQDGEVTSKTMFLGDQRVGGDPIEVESPEDLEPLVGTSSETMRHARASVAARNKAKVSVITGLAAFIVGGIASGFFVDTPFISEVRWIGVGMMVAGAILAYPVAKHYAREELELRARAFDAYTRDLGLRLDVCARGMQVVACEAPVAPPQATSQPPEIVPLEGRD